MNYGSHVISFVLGDIAINVSLKFSTVDFGVDCAGADMITCRDALVEQIAQIANITEDRLSPLRLETGKRNLVVIPSKSAH